MKILVTSGTGTVAKALIPGLQKLGHEVFAMTHSSGKAGLMADFDRPETWSQVLEGMDKLVLITPAIEGEGEKGVAFLRKAQACGIKHVVFLGIHHVERAPSIPHFQAKILIKKELEGCGLPFTIIEANNFFQNDLWFLQGIKKHEQYLQPLGDIGLNRVDVRDIADAITNALMNDEHHFRSYPLVGPSVLSGPRTGEIFSTFLNKKVSYPADALEKWEQLLSQYIPGWLLKDWKSMYEFFIREGLKAEAMDFVLQQKILNKPPRKYEDFVKELLEVL